MRTVKNACDDGEKRLTERAPSWPNVKTKEREQR